MKTYKFYKDEFGWFIDIPEWEGEAWDLQMVMGADVFCDLIAQGESEFYMTLSDTPLEGGDVLIFDKFGRLEGPEYGEGGWYKLKNYKGIRYEMDMWLCDVTKFVFNGDLPKHIYFR